MTTDKQTHPDDCSHKKHYGKNKNQELKTQKKECCSDENDKDEKESLTSENVSVDQNPKRFLYFGSNTVTVVLIILSLLSISQAVQTVSLFKTVQKENFVTPDTITNATSNNSDIPDMIGGC